MESISVLKQDNVGNTAANSACGSIKTILVPVSGSETDRVVLSAALAIAQPLQAHLEFVHLRLRPEDAAAHRAHIDPGLCPTMSIALADSTREQANLSTSAANYVMRFCEEHGVPICSTPGGFTRGVSADCTEECGPAIDTLMFHARRNDLTVLGRAQHADCLPTTFIEDVLVNSGRPLMIVPKTLTRAVLKTVVVGWKESAASARAVIAALPLLQVAQRVVLINIVEGESSSPKALEGVRRHLAWHDICAEMLQLGDGTGTADSLLPAAVRDLKAGLLVIGGFGHSRLRETVFGGVTRSLLKNADFPLYMAH